MDLTASDRFPQNHFPVLEMPAKEGEKGAKKEEKKADAAAPEEEKSAEEVKYEAKATVSEPGASSVLENRPKKKPSKTEKKATDMSNMTLL